MLIHNAQHVYADFCIDGFMIDLMIGLNYGCGPCYWTDEKETKKRKEKKSFTIFQAFQTICNFVAYLRKSEMFVILSFS